MAHQTGRRRKSAFGGVLRLFTPSAITHSARSTRAGYREVSTILDALRAPLLVSALAVGALGFPGQTYEIYRLFAEDFDFSGGFDWAQLRFLSFFVMLWLTTFVLWYIARVLSLTNDACKIALDQREWDGFVVRWGPRILGSAPAFAAAFGMARAEWTREGTQGTPGLYGAAAIAFAIGVVRLYATWRRARLGPHIYEDLRRTAFRYDVRIIAGALILAGVAFLMTQPIVFTQRVGALSIFCFFLIALVFLYAQLTYIYDRYAIPLVTALVAGVILFSAFDWNDNHFIRELEPTDEIREARLAAREFAEQFGPPIPVTVGSLFLDWYDGRDDKAAYSNSGRPYPVFVVAAQGGGVYAAYQTASFLAMLQDECPGFATHLFGVSGVSGGSVGATVYTALVKHFAANRAAVSLDEVCAPAAGQSPAIAARARRMLSQDFLTPLVSGLLFPDFTARFSPVALPAFDRARALEEALELSWNEAFRFPDLERRARALLASDDPAAQARGERILERLGVGQAPPPNPLVEGLLGYWTPNGVAPALFLNSTEAETGRRLVFSPAEEIGGGIRSYRVSVRPRDDGLTPDVRLSTAAMVSARFPYFSPAASMPLRQVEDQGGGFDKMRLVDGAYFENSGVDTALTVVQEIEEAADGAGLDVDVRLIVFDLTRDEFRDATYAFGELLSPIKTILNATVARSDLAQSRAREALNAPCRYIELDGAEVPGAAPGDPLSRTCSAGEIKRSRVWSVSLNDYEYDFQLGWILSSETLTRIRDQLGHPAACGAIGEAAEPLLDQLAQSAPTVQASAVGQPQALLGRSAESVRERVREALEERRAQQADDAVASHNSCVARFIVETLSGR